MGPPDLRTLVTQQTDQIITLTSQLEASFAHSANLNTRLLTALDTLDTLQAELDAERRKNDKHLWVNLTQELQREKEEMKEVVELLINKVQRSKGSFSRWPSASMYLPTPAGRSTRFIDFTPLPIAPPRMEALLNALACERGRYKQASEALHNAHEIILTLEAQVARREAELECRDHQHNANVKPIPRKRSLLEALRPSPPGVPLSEVVHSLSVAEERNHALEQEIRELHTRGLGYKGSPHFVSVAVQTSPPSEPETTHPTRRSPPTAPTRTRSYPRGGVTNAVEDLQARVDLLSDAISGFKKERESMKDTLEARKKPTDTKPDSPSTIPPSVVADAGVSPVPHPPSREQLSPEPPSPRPPPKEPHRDFQHILRVEHECIRLTRINERLERELSELRAGVDVSPASNISSISFIRSPALRSPALPTVSPSGFSVRSSGERDMDISSTPLHLFSTLPDEEGQAQNHLSDFEFFLGHAQPPAPDNSSMNAEPSRNETVHPDSQECGISRSANRPSSAPPNIDDTHPSVLLSPFQLSTSLPPRSRSVEPRLGRQERILEIQHELDVVNEDLVAKNRDFDELRELVNRLKDQAI